MDVSILICTHGDSAWEELAWSRAYPSAAGQCDDVRVEHFPNHTLAQARNIAAIRFPNETRDWLCFLDADDELAPDYIEAMQQAIRAGTTPGFRKVSWPEDWVKDADFDRPPFALFVPQIQYVHPNGREEKPRFPNRQVPMEEMNHAVIGTLVPRKLFLEVGGFREEPYAEDWALWLRCLRAGAEMVDVSAAVYRAFVRPEGRNSHERSFREQWYWRIRREHAKALAG